MSGALQRSATRQAVVLTALTDEYRAVRAHVRDLREIVDNRGTIYEAGFFDTPKGVWRVALARIGMMGNVAAAIAAQSAILEFKPSVLLMVGIAGGLKGKVALGDVVVATDVYSYEAGKLSSAGDFVSTRTPIRVSSHRLQQRAYREAAQGAWLKRRINPTSNQPLPHVYLGTIASGEKLIRTRKIPEFLDHKVVAVETESYGVLSAVRDANVDVLIVRGIADLLEESKSDDWRKTAAVNASAFAFEVLARLDPEPGVAAPTNEPREDLTERYIAELNVTNIRSVTEINWKFGEGPGWHVLIGHNGAGKTTVLRTIALVLLSRRETDILVRDWNNWLPPNRDIGRLSITLGSSVHPALIERFIELSRVATEGPNSAKVVDNENGRETPADVFSVGYGPFRRFSGGDLEYEEEIRSSQRLLRHRTLFTESAALADSLTWLKDLRFKQLEGHTDGEFLEDVKAFINGSDLLPQGTRLSQVSSEAVIFLDPAGCPVEIKDLSDGFRSVLSLVLDLLRNMAAAYGSTAVFSRAEPDRVTAAGIMLIDEVDVHLHPTWQHSIGEWFRKHFPRVQFVVATHSLLICQSADTVYLLPRPGTGERGRMLSGVELDRVRYGNVLDAYSTGVFGQGVDRSERSKEMLMQLAELNARELEEDLTPDEQAEQERLRAILPTAAHSTKRGPRG